MATLYDVIATYTVVEFLPPNRQQKLLEIVARSKPSGVEFYARVANDKYVVTATRVACHDIAVALNTDAEIPGVAGITINQDIDANNQVDYSLDVDVVSDSGNSTMTLTLPWADVFPPAMEAPVAKAVEDLNAIEEA